MIWHMEHRHTGATCFSADEAKKALWDQAIDSAKENGVIVLQFLVMLLHIVFSLLLKHRIMIP